jgi:hypothetical protein
VSKYSDNELFRFGADVVHGLRQVIDEKDARIASLESALENDAKPYLARILELESKLMEIGATCNGECGCKGYLQMHFKARP